MPAKTRVRMEALVGKNEGERVKGRAQALIYIFIYMKKRKKGKSTAGT